MKNKSFALIVLLAIFAFTYNTKAQLVDVAVSEDSWVSEDAPDQNNNGITDLECAMMDTDTLLSREVYLKFNIKEYSGLIKSAQLQVVAAQKSADDGWIELDEFLIEVLGVSNEWGEDSLTWNNKPIVASPVLATANITSFSSYNITGEGLADHINNAILNGDTVVSFVIKGKSETNGSRIWISDQGWEPAHLKVDIVETEEVSLKEDTWISEDAPDQNNNGITDMEVAVIDTDSMKTREAYVKFDISSFSGYVDDAILSIMAAQKEEKDGWIELDNFYLDVYGTKSNWHDTSMTWNNKPEDNSGVLATINVTDFSRYGISSEALNTYITHAIANGNTEISFAFRGREETNGSRIWISDQGWEPVKLQMATFEVTEKTIVQDTWVSEDQPKENFNGETDLQVARMNTDTMKNRETYVQFNIKDLDGFVSFAALRMASAQKSADDGYIELDEFFVQVYGANNEWGEDTMTWNNKPETSSEILAEENITNFKTYEICGQGIANHINRAIENGDTLVSFVFKGRDLTNGSRIWISDQGWIPVKLVVETIEAESLSVLEDSWVSEDLPDQNHNGITDLEVAMMDTDTLENREAYFKFNLKDISEQQAKATLRIVSAQKEEKDGWAELSEFNIGVYGAGNDWAEETLTWNNKPENEDLLATKNVTGFNYYYITSGTLTEYINEAITAGDTAISFAIKGMDITNGSRIWISDQGWEPAMLILDNGIREEINVESIALNKETITIDVGQSETLTATIAPENATDKSVSWASSDNNIATVEDGIVTAIAKGNATITVTSTDGGHTATCEITVKDAVAVSGIALDITEINMEKGDTQQLTATISPENATNKNVTWETGNPMVAIISDEGVVSAQGNGSTTISVTTEDGGHTATCNVIVGTTSIHQSASNFVNVYPNPADNILSIDLSERQFDVLIIRDLTGKIVLQKNIQTATGNLKINVQDFSEGIYILSLQNSLAEFNSKIIIK